MARAAEGEASAPLFDAEGALSREYLLRRGYCCRHGCRNCPYGFRKDAPRPAGSPLAGERSGHPPGAEPPAGGAAEERAWADER